ncbi:ROK family protein [Martelella alba]|uniref:N-acetylglucosamine kinase n=1 Tax=Martelella alba TaxID=2590451 RepID=A0A506UFS8_9HYPH|nr:ROK family protein [Martelella alba]TPW32456.1 ROK family protein [Martelella alba]
MPSNILCFDIGGTSIRAGHSRAMGDLTFLERIATPTDDHAGFIAALSAFVGQLDEKPARIAVSLAGVVDPKTGGLIVANIPAIHGTDLAQDLAEATGIAVTIANDADCFAVAEAVVGSGAGHDIVFGIILGTGVGGGLVSGERLINRKGGFAGEWGHGPVAAQIAGMPPRPVPRFACGCGQTGCLDTAVSARGMERLDRLFHGGERSAEAILEAWRAGEVTAVDTLSVYLDLIAAPLAMVVNMTGASIVPAGGGLARAHDLVGAIDRAVRPLTLAQPSTPLVVPATSGTEPGLLGAAILGRQALEEV